MSTIATDRSALFRLDSTKEHRNRWGDSWFRAGVVIVNGEGKYLLVEECRAKINGVYQDVEDIWNFPSGSCELAESITKAAVREASEETGFLVELTGVCNIIHTHREKDPYLMVVFTARLISDERGFDRKEIKSHRWFDREEILSLYAQHKLRSPRFVLDVLANLSSNLIMPLSILDDKS